MSRIAAIALILIVQTVACRNVAVAGEWSGSVAGQTRFFLQSASAAGQSDYDISLSFQPLYYHEWTRRQEHFLFEPFVRLDQNDKNRTHVDIRELYWQKVGGSWELLVGLKKVFWGVIESKHLVDVINQTDLVESPDTEDKLGQPMALFSWIQPWGDIEFYAMPLFRERTFPGPDGRLRGPLTINTDEAVYESGAKWHHFDWAVRWSHSLSDYDVGLAHFVGTTRDPLLLPRITPNGIELIPRYDLMNRTSLDLQATKGDWLWKVEAFTEQIRGDRHAAFSAGFERTYVGIRGGSADLGALIEYHFDSRGHHAATPFENDWFAGARLALNDVQSSELLGGLILDAGDGGIALFVEASRRIGADYTLEVEFRGAMNAPADDPLALFTADDFLLLEFARHF